MASSPKRRELLVYGYIKEIEKQYETLSIPSDINDIIYLFQRLCDEWDATNSHSHTTIDELTGSILFNYDKMEKWENEMTVYGSNKVCQGIYVWRLKIISIELRDKWEAYPYIGIIQDSNDSLQSYQHRGSWQSYGCQLCAGNGGLWCKEGIADAGKDYECEWRRNCDILQMILDLEQGTLRFIVNDKDCGIAFSNIQIATYRLAMTCSRNSSLQSTSSFQLL